VQQVILRLLLEKSVTLNRPGTQNKGFGLPPISAVQMQKRSHEIATMTELLGALNGKTK